MILTTVWPAICLRGGCCVRPVPFSSRSTTSALLSLLSNIEAKLKFPFFPWSVGSEELAGNVGFFQVDRTPHVCCEEASGFEGAAIVIYFDKYL